MKTILASILVLACMIVSANVLYSYQSNYKKTSLVIIKLDKPASANVSKAVAIASKHQGMTHEYNCTASAIIVYRYNHNLNERADVIQFFQKILAKELPGVKIEIVFCDIMSNENIGKC